MTDPSDILPATIRALRTSRHPHAAWLAERADHAHWLWSQYRAPLLEAGWTATQLFGVSQTAAPQRLDRQGALIMSKPGDNLTRITLDAIEFATPSRARLCRHKAQIDANAVPIWLHPAARSGDGKAYEACTLGEAA